MRTPISAAHDASRATSASEGRREARSSPPEEAPRSAPVLTSRPAAASGAAAAEATAASASAVAAAAAAAREPMQAEFEGLDINVCRLSPAAEWCTP